MEVRFSSPLFHDHSTSSFVSSEVVTIEPPSGEKLQEKSIFLIRRLPDGESIGVRSLSQAHTSPSLLALTRVLPSGSSVSPQIPCLWPRRILGSGTLAGSWMSQMRMV